MSLEFVLTDLAGRKRSELPGGRSKTVAVPLRATGTSSVVVDGTGTDADALLEGDGLLRVYDVDPTFTTQGNRRLLAHHRLVGAEEVAGDGKVTVAAAFADPSWVLARRLIGKSAGGYAFGGPLDLRDRGAIMADIVAAVNAEGPTGIRMGNVTPSGSTYVAGWVYKKAGEALQELSATLDGPDYRVRPVEWSAGVYGELDVAPSLSSYRANAAFEYGDGRLNVKNYTRSVALEGTANRVYAIPPGYPDQAAGSVLYGDDGPSQAVRGLLEDVITTDLAVEAFRQDLIRGHLVARAGPRQTISFTPIQAIGTRTPKLGRDFEVGDVVPFRATITGPDQRAGAPRGATVKRKRIDIRTRIYGWSASTGDDGTIAPSLTLVPQ